MNVAFAVGTLNYLPFIRVLVNSFLKHHPNWEFKFFVLDQPNEDFSSYRENFELVKITKLNIKNLKQFLFKYTVLETSTGVKPWCFEYLFEKGYNKVIFFDSDILVLNPLNTLIDQLNTHSVILTPHILTEIPNDGLSQTNLNISVSGTYNLGFAAFSNKPNSKKVLEFWKNALYRQGFMEISKGMHVDQKWMEFVPSLVEDYLIWHDPTYNVAYWNLHERKVIKKGDDYFVEFQNNTLPLTFYHFSGINFSDLKLLSKHQTRYRLSPDDDLYSLFVSYKNQIYENGYENFIKIPYSYNYFDNGIAIATVMRRAFNEIWESSPDKYPDPFDTKVKNSFYDYLTKDIETKEMSVLEHAIVKRLNLKIVTNKDLLEFYHSLAEKSDLSRDLNFDPILSKAISKKAENYFEYEPFGLNIFGYMNEEFGVAKVPRLFIEALEQNSIPYAVKTIRVGGRGSEELHNVASSKKLPYLINVYFINADMIKSTKSTLLPEEYIGKYEIGDWSWELEEFPHFFHDAYSDVNEFWIHADLMADSVRRYSPKPVYKYDLPYLINKKQTTNKADVFTFLVVFDYLSDIERKNPQMAIKAFRTAFPLQENVKLVIKSSNASRFEEEHKSLKDLARGDSRIQFIDEIMKPDTFNSLFESSHCYVSLHRSEGCGLNIYDAIFKEIPLICTRYGGDIPSWPDYPYFVDYQMTPIKKGFQQYIDSNCPWAEPDLEDAIQKMKMVYEDWDQAYYEIKQLHQRLHARYGHPYQFGKFIKERMEQIKTICEKQRVILDKKVNFSSSQNIEGLISRESKILLLQTATPVVIQKTINLIRNTHPSAQIHLLGKNPHDFKAILNRSYLYPDSQGNYTLQKMKKLAKEMKGENYDLVLIPFHNFNNSIKSYNNILEIAKAIVPNETKIIAMSMSGDFYQIDFNTFHVSMSV